MVETFVAEVATNGLKGRSGRVARSELWFILTGAGVGRAQSWGSTVARSATYFDPRWLNEIGRSATNKRPLSHVHAVALVRLVPGMSHPSYAPRVKIENLRGLS